MPVFINNKFSHDTYDGRRARLQLLSANIAVQGPIIGLSASLTTWATGASGAFAGLATGQQLEAAEAIAATAAFNTAFDAAREEYVKLREELVAQLDDEDAPDEIGRERYGFDGLTPYKWATFVGKVELFVANHAVMLTENPDYTLAPAKITALTGLVAAALALNVAAGAEESEAVAATKAIKAEYRNGTKKLRRILAAATDHYGADGAELTLFGFARQSEQTGGGQPAAPTLSYAAPNVVIAAAPNTTSVDVERSDDDGATSTEIVSAENVTSVPLPQEAADVWARARARNANGTGAWSPWLIIPALSLAPILNFLYTMGAGFSWTAVGETIRLEASYDGGMTWNEIAFGVNPSGTYNWTPPAGMFRIRREAGGIVGPWSVITVTTP